MNEWFEKLWDDYITSCPDAMKLHDIMQNLNENIVNDHIAIRTFNGGGISLNKLRQYMQLKNFAPIEGYEFKEKNLIAEYYQHPDPNVPRVFISELQVQNFSNSFQSIVNDLLDQSLKYVNELGIDIPLIPWKMIRYTDYQILNKESDYASWLAVHGLKANHFTVSINHLNQFNNIEEFNDFLIENNFVLNTNGGIIKGSRKKLLKQSSTMAHTLVKNFSDGIYSVPGCFYEFAERFEDENGELFYGFIGSSAFKIFESTNPV